MPGHMPGIHVFLVTTLYKDVDGRNKAGQDGKIWMQAVRKGNYRRRMPPSVPRTIARPIELPVLPPIALPMSAAT